MKRMQFLLIFALCLSLAMAPMAWANSAPSVWDGGTASGMAVKGDACPIVVERETLTFDVPEFPKTHYPSEAEQSAYGAKVTAEYFFRNPTGETVTATLLFPFGSKPDYVTWEDTDGYGVTVDGEAVEVTLRGSLFSYGEDFEVEKDLARLADGYVEDSFYAPELLVTKYYYDVSGVDHEANPAAFAAAELSLDREKTRVLFLEFNGGDQIPGGVRVGRFLDDNGASADLVLYVIGEPLSEGLEWKVYENAKCETQIGGAANLIRSETMSFTEVALTEYPADCVYSETDWYNAFVAELNRNEWSQGVIGPDVQWKLERSMMRWYEYDITIAPGETIVNTVTAPIWPGIHAGYEPPIYDYTYLLTPAKGWAEFGDLDIRINTPYALYQCNLEGFEKTEEGYSLSLNGLPEKDLVFILCEKQNPRKPGSGNWLPIFCIVCAALIPAVLFIRRRKRR